MTRRVLGGRLPFGYARTRRGVKIDTARAEVVRLIFELRDRGYTVQAVADELNERKIPATHGGQWYASKVHQGVLAMRRKYEGGKIERVGNGAKWPQILGDVDLDQVEAETSTRVELPSKPTKRRYRKLKR